MVGRAFPCSAWRLFHSVLYLGLEWGSVDGVEWRLYFIERAENFSCVNGFDIPSLLLLPCACAHIKWRHKGGEGYLAYIHNVNSNAMMFASAKDSKNIAGKKTKSKCMLHVYCSPAVFLFKDCPISPKPIHTHAHAHDTSMNFCSLFRLPRPGPRRDCPPSTHHRSHSSDCDDWHQMPRNLACHARGTS